MQNPWEELPVTKHHLFNVMVLEDYPFAPQGSALTEMAT